MARQKKVDYKDRQMVRKELDLYEEISIAEILKLCGNDLNACVETQYNYGDTSIILYWYEPETDEEMQKRIAKHEAELERWKKKEKDKKAKLLEQEKKEYLRLKKKFEKKCQISK